MTRVTLNVNNVRLCAFCKHWYDPANTFIRPLFGKDRWEYDETAKALCNIKKKEMKAFANCSEYEQKV